MYNVPLLLRKASVDWVTTLVSFLVSHIVELEIDCCHFQVYYSYSWPYHARGSLKSLNSMLVQCTIVIKKSLRCWVTTLDYYLSRSQIVELEIDCCHFQDITYYSNSWPARGHWKAYIPCLYNVPLLLKASLNETLSVLDCQSLKRGK